VSLTRFHPSWDKIISENLQAVDDQGCHLEESSPYKGTAYTGVYCIEYSLFLKVLVQGDEVAAESEDE
jgi:hypothetical protein